MILSLMEGNEAIARGAVAAGCRFFAGYPITPATTTVINPRMTVRERAIAASMICMASRPAVRPLSPRQYRYRFQALR